MASVRWAVGSEPGLSDLMGWNTTAAASGQHTWQCGSLSSGVRLYVTVEATDGAGLTTAVTSAAVLVDNVAPTASYVMLVRTPRHA